MLYVLGTSASGRLDVTCSCVVLFHPRSALFNTKTLSTYYFMCFTSHLCWMQALPIFWRLAAARNSSSILCT